MYNCEDIFDKTDDYLDGNLSDFECANFENHLKNCEECKKSVDFARELNNVMHSMPSVEPPKDLLDNLHREINKSKKVVFYKKWQPYSALAACIVLAVVIKTNVAKELNETTSYLDLSTPAPTIYQTSEPFSENNNGTSVDEVRDITSASEMPADLPSNTAVPSATDTALSTTAPISVFNEKTEISQQEIEFDDTFDETDYTPQPQIEYSEKSHNAGVGEAKQSVKSEQAEKTAAEDIPVVMSLVQSDTMTVYGNVAENTSQTETKTDIGSAKTGATSGSSAKIGGSGGGSSAKARVNTIGTENKEKVQEIIERLGITAEGGTYTASENIYDEFLSALENEGIEFDDIHTYDGEKIRFIIKWI